jgi:predicted nucleic acid-binding protein
VVLVDSSVWIDFYRGRATPNVAKLGQLVWRGGQVVVGDLILAEVLQGSKSDTEFKKISRELSLFPQIAISDPACAIQSAQNYRALRSLGVTVRKTIDTLIATRCIMDKIPLLYSDRDFDPFVEHLGLIAVTKP